MSSNTFHSGEIGTTGREPFENASGTIGTGVTGQHATSGLTGSTGVTTGAGVGSHHGHSGTAGHEHSKAHYGTTGTTASGAGLTGSNTGAYDSTTTGSRSSATGTGSKDDRSLIDKAKDAVGLDNNKNTSDSYDSTRGATGHQHATGAGTAAGVGAGATAGGIAGSHHQHTGTAGHEHSKEHYGDQTSGSTTDKDTGIKTSGLGAAGGVAGFGTSDKDFTNSDRLGSARGAYGDEAGPFKGNTDGPTTSALTGREGNSGVNAVSGKTGGAYGSESTAPGTHTGTDAFGTGAHGNTGAHGTTGTTGTHGTHGTHGTTGSSGLTTGNADLDNTAKEGASHQKKGIIEKVKDVLTN